MLSKIAAPSGLILLNYSVYNCNEQGQSMFNYKGTSFAMKHLLLVIFVGIALGLSAQGSDKYTGPYADFYKAEDLFTKEQYGSARIAFRSFADRLGDKNDPFYLKALYYEGISALELYNNDAILLLIDFNQNYPESIYKHQIYKRIGEYYFQKKDYKNALIWLSKLDKFQVGDDTDAFYFKLGSAYFETGDFLKARNAFYEVKDGQSTYAAPALYYYSHIAYQDQSYQAALEGFEKLVLLPDFKQLAQQYIIQIYYRQKKYEDVTRLGPLYVDEMSENIANEMNHMIGDAYYEQERFDEAAPYLQKYNQKVKTSRAEDYQLAYAYYRSSSYKNAIDLFDKVARVKDTLGQISLYHIGESYLKLGESAYARTAFEAAAVIPLNEHIREDALYNYAILSYKLDINPYDEAIEALELYLSKYPNSDRKKEVYEYLLNVYTSTNNYALALSSLDKIPNKDIRLKSAYQMIAFNQGADRFRKGNFNGAIESFYLVNKYQIDDHINAEALFWAADAHYMLKKYDLALNGYRLYLANPGAFSSPKRKDALYNMAYVHYTRSAYPEAIEAFRLYLQEPNLTNKAQKSDVLLRLGDAYYTSKQNDLAIKSYMEHLALNHNNQDHALYYMAKTYGYKNDPDNKVKYLLELINNQGKSTYVPQAIYDVGLSYRFKNEDLRAQNYFKQLISDYPKSNLVNEAQIEIADIYFKEKNYAKSEELYKRILSNNESNRTSCGRIVKGIVEIYKVQGKPEKIEGLIKEYPCSDYTIDDQEELYYNTAVEPYLDSAFQRAIPQLEKYLAKFTKGKYENEILFYLANSHYQLKHDSVAVELYEKILKSPNSSFTETAAIRASKHLYNNAKYAEALPYYVRLEETTASPDVAYNALIGALRCNYLLLHWNNCEIYAKKVLDNSKLTPVIEIEATFALGMAQFNTEKYKEANKALEWTITNARNVFAAEAKYTTALIAYKESQWDLSETKIKELLKMKPSYDFWIAKGLLLQSKILIAKEDLFQAEYTLKSIIDHYTNKEDGILIEANQLWDELMQLKNQPKVVKEPGTTIIEIKKNEK